MLAHLLASVAFAAGQRPVFPVYPADVAQQADLDVLPVVQTYGVHGSPFTAQ